MRIKGAMNNQTPPFRIFIIQVHVYTIYLKGTPSCAGTETNKHDLQTFNKIGTFLMFPELGFISLQKSNPKTEWKS